MSQEKRNDYVNRNFDSARLLRVAAKFCFIFALVVASNMFNCATATAQLVFGGQSQPSIGVTDASGKTWISMSRAAMNTETLLRQPLTTALHNAENFFDVMEALHDLGLDTVLTASAQEDALTEDEAWEIIGNANEIGVTLSRYLESRNAVYEITKSGAIRFISLDEIGDMKHFQTIVYRVDHLAGSFRELAVLADNIQSSVARDEWEMGGGQATILPRIQSGRRLLMVSIHYQHHRRIRQLLYELTVAANGPAAFRSSSRVVGSVPNSFSTSRVVKVPAVKSRLRKPNPANMALGLHRQFPAGGVF